MTDKIEELEKEIEKSKKKIIEKARKDGDELTSEQILNNATKQMKEFTDNFWIYNQCMAEKELTGLKEGIEIGRIEGFKSGWIQGRQETIAEVEKMIDEMKKEGAFIGTKETLKLPNYIKQKLQEMKT